LSQARSAASAVPGGARVFHRMFTRLGCQGRPPRFVVEYYPYANLSHTIRLREDVAYARLSDLLRGSRLAVLEAAAALLLARLYRRQPPGELLDAYREFSLTRQTRRRLRRMRQVRSRRRKVRAHGAFFDLGALYSKLDQRYFRGALRKPRLGWSLRAWRTQLGCFEPALDQIILNARLDRSDVPQFAVEYVLYHEMLHVKHPIRAAHCGFQSHSPSFRREERRFAHYERARRFLARLS
jgi:hypothetical protein